VSAETVGFGEVSCVVGVAIELKVTGELVGEVKRFVASPRAWALTEMLELAKTPVEYTTPDVTPM
jgi:hypothetical protein